MTDIISNWIAGLDLLDLLGVAGVCGYVGAYFMLQIGVLKGEGYTFPLINLVASACILTSLSRDFNPYSASVEIAWSTISIIGLVRIFLIHKLTHFSDEEVRTVELLAPGLKKDRARKLLRVGRFIDLAAGDSLAHESQPVEGLTVILRGHCTVRKGGAQVATLGPGALVGEMTYASRLPATADVVTDTAARLFLLPGAALVDFLRNNPDIASAMDQATGADIRRKLAETTARLAQNQSGRH